MWVQGTQRQGHRPPWWWKISGSTWDPAAEVQNKLDSYKGLGLDLFPYKSNLQILAIVWKFKYKMIMLAKPSAEENNSIFNNLFPSTSATISITSATAFQAVCV